MSLVEERANNHMCKTALAILVIQAGGKIRLSAKDLERMPDGSLAFVPTEDGGLEFAYVRS